MRYRILKSDGGKYKLQGKRFVCWSDMGSFDMKLFKWVLKEFDTQKEAEKALSKSISHKRREYKNKTWKVMKELESDVVLN